LNCPQKSSLAVFALEEELELAGAEAYISNRGTGLLYFTSYIDGWLVICKRVLLLLHNSNNMMVCRTAGMHTGGR
jgi:hypothetical protein